SNPDWEVLGLVRTAQPVPDLPDNVTLVPWGPQRALLEHADVAVIHAGVASVIECIEAEVPMLLYPQVNDQQGNAARVAFHGLGLIGDHGDTALTLARQITELSRDKDVARRLAEMHRRFDAAADDKALERAVATLANTGRLS
ncbi:MAG: nucleotide disphospho-sugar-binding domain-containing protein, partial [Pseudomonadota bacterium]